MVATIRISMLGSRQFSIYSDITSKIRKETDRVRHKIRKIEAQVGNVGEDVWIQALDGLYDKVIQATPVDTGTLVNSVFIGTENFRGTTRAVLGIGGGDDVNPKSKKHPKEYAKYVEAGAGYNQHNAGFFFGTIQAYLPQVESSVRNIIKAKVASV